MKINTISIEKFKGLPPLVIEANGNNLNIIGDNATGKTSIADAVFWVIDGKDANGRTDFEIKSLGADGKPIPMQDHSVELVIEHKGQPIKLKKTLSELWVKSKGSVKNEFSGHKTTYAVNGIPVQKKEFDATIASVCDAGFLRLLMDPLYFSSKLPWQPRRNQLMELCHEPSEADVIAANKNLSPLEAYRTGQSIETFRKQIAARKAIINNELKAIPVRVDEATRAMPQRGETDLVAVRSELDKARQELAEVEVKLRSVMQSSESGVAGEKRLRLADNQRHFEAQQRSLSDAQTEEGRLAAQEEKLEAELVRRRKEWADVDAEEFVPSDTGNCPACGQDLPPELQAAAVAKAQAAFVADKDDRLAVISSAGKMAAAHLAQVQNRRQALRETVESLTPQIAELGASIDTLQAELAADEKASEQVDQQNEMNDLTRLRDELQKKVDALARRDAVAAQIEAGEARIAELKQQEAKLAEEYAELEQQTFLTEEFMRTKVRLLDDKINSKFKLARFRLFEQQVNGALNEVCEVLGPDLVPYNAGLNHAAQINTGIDIINTLSAHYGFSAPIFIDNAEAVTQLIDTPAQVIRLVVAEGVKELRVVAAEGETWRNELENTGTQQQAKVRYDTFAAKETSKGNKDRLHTVTGTQSSNERLSAAKATSTAAIAAATSSVLQTASPMKGPGF